jgi:hypothetical protein
MAGLAPDGLEQQGPAGDGFAMMIGIGETHVSPDAFFVGRLAQIAPLAARERIPAAFALRDEVVAGGLMS